MNKLYHACHWLFHSAYWLRNGKLDRGNTWRQYVAVKSELFPVAHFCQLYLIDSSVTSVRHCKPEPFFESLDPLLGNHCIFSNLFILFFSLNFNSLFFRHFQKCCKRAFIYQRTTKETKRVNRTEEVKNFRQHIRERNHDIVSVCGMVFSL